VLLLLLLLLLWVDSRRKLIGVDLQGMSMQTPTSSPANISAAIRHGQAQAAG